jgi:hypothetical protein
MCLFELLAVFLSRMERTFDIVKILAIGYPVTKDGKSNENLQIT